MAVTYSGDAATTRTNLGLGSLATANSVNASTIDDNSVGAAELNVSGNGTSGQVLTSDGDGSFSWANAGGMSTIAAASLGDVGTHAILYNPSTTTTYSAGATESGASLRYAGVIRSTTPQTTNTGSAPSGTWRILSVYDSNVGNKSIISGLWLRIS